MVCKVQMNIVLNGLRVPDFQRHTMVIHVCCALCTIIDMITLKFKRQLDNSFFVIGSEQVGEEGKRIFKI